MCYGFCHRNCYDELGDDADLKSKAACTLEKASTSLDAMCCHIHYGHMSSLLVSVGSYACMRKLASCLQTWRLAEYVFHKHGV